MLDFPPYYIVDDKREGLGRDEAVIQLLNQALKDYTVSTIMMPASRAIYALRDTDKLRCLISLYKTRDRVPIFKFFFRVQHSWLTNYRRIKANHIEQT
ncbi:hypothetical protein [Pseudoalteromonas xiamenensis]|uniref:Uncharacterized protein n=1 Tax=Pseudoalteromonas xiamenensis TaxID=882626 RepID=A0A975HL70_9GAMM|nr:hypothetical protein [Pseudoalteromonas xiamenensis]QTH71783.1 hypothetical protein J5O05_02175 [Pseudoalteromonas xiamenensis]